MNWFPWLAGFAFGALALFIAYMGGVTAKEREYSRLLEEHQNRKNESERKQREQDRIQLIDTRAREALELAKLTSKALAETQRTQAREIERLQIEIMALKKPAPRKRKPKAKS